MGLDEIYDADEVNFKAAKLAKKGLKGVIMTKKLSDYKDEDDIDEE